VGQDDPVHRRAEAHVPLQEADLLLGCCWASRRTRLQLGADRPEVPAGAASTVRMMNSVEPTRSALSHDARCGTRVHQHLDAGDALAHAATSRR
jgi:hypothetical protein